ncbi:MAG TPA: hypothetical protein VKE41_10605 [Roseiflexaceae bacterium]|nr:hypothetical protein [Roseiflexaceae bacterium]
MFDFAHVSAVEHGKERNSRVVLHLDRSISNAHHKRPVEEPPLDQHTNVASAKFIHLDVTYSSWFGSPLTEGFSMGTAIRIGKGISTQAQQRLQPGWSQKAAARNQAFLNALILENRWRGGELRRSIACRNAARMVVDPTYTPEPQAAPDIERAVGVGGSAPRARRQLR